MAVVDRIFAIIIMASILVCSLIHLGVSVGTIVPYRKYGDMFRPQIGLSGYNLFICLFGFLTGILGLISISTQSERFARIVCLVSGLLGVFALASLVAALVANSKSSNYVSSHFSSRLFAYKTSADSSNIVDLLQNKYQCCGTDMWIDWTRGELNGTAPVTSVTNTTTTTTTGTNTTTTTTTASATATTTATTTTTTATTTTTTPTTTTSVTTTTMTNPTTTTSQSVTTSGTSSASNKKRDINHISDNLRDRRALQLAYLSRKKRQGISTYGGIEGLPITFGVLLPGSCCTSDATYTDNTYAYCISNYNGTVNQFYTVGCAKPIGVTAGNQFMGFVVINSFMTVLAFVAIPVMLGNPSNIL